MTNKAKKEKAPKIIEQKKTKRGIDQRLYGSNCWAMEAWVRKEGKANQSGVVQTTLHKGKEAGQCDNPMKRYGARRATNENRTGKL